MSAEAIDTTQRYDLFTRDGSTKFQWRLKDEGIGLTPAGIEVMRANRWTDAAYTDIASVTLTTGVIGTGAPMAACTIKLNNGGQIIVTNVTARGIADGARNGAYRSFVRDFHQHLVDSGAATGITFHSGFTQRRLSWLIFALILAAILFIATPLGILIFTRDTDALWMLIAGVGLVFPVMRVAKSNRPAAYLPGAPPDLLP